MRTAYFIALLICGADIVRIFFIAARYKFAYHILAAVFAFEQTGKLINRFPVGRDTDVVPQKFGGKREDFPRNNGFVAVFNPYPFGFGFIHAFLYFVAFGGLFALLQHARIYLVFEDSGNGDGGPFGLTELNREIVDSLVDSIIVYDHERIEIKFKYADEFVIR